MTQQIDWESGTGKIYLTYNGTGNGQIVVTSDDNNLYEQRRQDITVKTIGSEVARVVTVIQKAKVPNFVTRDRKMIITSDGKYFNIKI